MIYETDEYGARPSETVSFTKPDERIVDSVIRTANIERSDDMEDELYKYAASGDRFIIDPEEKRFYDTHLDETGYVDEDMVYPPTAKLMDVIHDLRNHPFILFDKYENTRFAVYQKEDLEGGELPQIPPKEEICIEEIGYDELYRKYPDLAEQVSSDTSSSPRYGIFSLSDLNKRPIRNRLYSYVADLEMALAEAIEKEYPKSGPLAEIVSYTTRESWESNRDIPPESHISQFMNLSDMKNLVEDSQSLSTQCGFKKDGMSIKEVESDEDFGKLDSGEALSKIKDYRNRIIHANRILVSDRDDYNQLLTSLQLIYIVLGNLSDSYALEKES